jgi:hypothetical protein
MLKQRDTVSRLRRTIASQWDEAVQVKDGAGRPEYQARGMDQATNPKPALTGAGARPKSGKREPLRKCVSARR